MVHALAKVLGCCRFCSERKDGEVWKPLSSFVSFTDHTTAASAWKATLACGRGLLCFPCRRERGDYAGKTPFCESFEKHREYFKLHPDMLKALGEVAERLRECIRHAGGLEEGKRSRAQDLLPAVRGM